MDPQPCPAAPRRLGFSAYEWLVIGAGWAGWGFDVFDAVLFNFVAPNCIPTLLHLSPGTAAAHAAVLFWTGAITSVLLLGWAAGGVLFGWLGDRIGRKRALFATIAIYALGTGLCALVSNLGELILCRTLASLGIGGEWGIGAALIAETVAPGRRVAAGVLMQTASPLGIVLASAVNYQIAGVWFASDPHNSWRYVFLAGLAPLLVAFAVRLFLRESAPWQASRARPRAPLRRASCSRPSLRRATLERGVRRGDRGAHLVGLQCVHPAARQHPRHRIRGGHAARGAGGAAARGRLAGARLQRLQFRAACRGAGRDAAGRRLSRRQLFITYFLFSARSARPRRSVCRWPPQLRLNAAVSRRRGRLRGVRRAHLLPAGAVSGAPARHRRGLLLQHRPGRAPPSAPTSSAR